MHERCSKKKTKNKTNKPKLHLATRTSTNMNTIMGVSICDFVPDGKVMSKIILSELLTHGVTVLQHRRKLVGASAHWAKLTKINPQKKKKITKQRPAQPSFRTISRKVDQATPSRKETPPLEPAAGTGRALGCCWCHRRYVPLPHLAKSKPVTQFPSSIPAIHPGSPPTHSTCTLTRKTLEACFHDENRAGGWASAAAQFFLCWSFLYLNAFWNTDESVCEITILRRH